MIVTKTITDKQRRVIMENIAEYLSELVRDFEKVND